MPRSEPLTAARIVEAAVAVADAGGLQAVSMRSVGREAGVEAMSLYHHVASKDALLDALADWIFERIENPIPGGAWRDEMAKRARSARRVLTAHPWALALVESRRHPGVALLEHHESVLACLRAAGFSVRLAAHAFSVIDAYIYGFALTERNLPFEPGPDAGDFIGAVLARVSVPNLADVARAYVEQNYAFAEEFEHGLDLILDGIALRLAADETDGSTARA